MDVIKSAREMCAELKKDERFIEYINAKEANDNDAELQKQIGEFNLVRMQLDEALTAAEKDEEKINSLNNQLRDIYTVIMETPSMINYNNAKTGLDDLVSQIYSLIDKTILGEDPMTVDCTVKCTGSCSTCGGCH